MIIYSSATYSLYQVYHEEKPSLPSLLYICVFQVYRYRSLTRIVINSILFWMRWFKSDICVFYNTTLKLTKNNDNCLDFIEFIRVRPVNRLPSRANESRCVLLRILGPAQNTHARDVTSGPNRRLPSRVKLIAFFVGSCISLSMILG